MPLVTSKHVRMQGDDLVGGWQEGNLGLPLRAFLHEFLHPCAEHSGVAVVLGNRIDEVLNFTRDLLNST